MEPNAGCTLQTNDNVLYASRVAAIWSIKLGALCMPVRAIRSTRMLNFCPRRHVSMSHSRLPSGPFSTTSERGSTTRASPKTLWPSC